MMLLTIQISPANELALRETAEGCGLGTIEALIESWVEHRVAMIESWMEHRAAPLG